jgi:4-hydroxy-3-polyprenylbenzoate decarboxylase
MAGFLNGRGIKPMVRAKTVPLLGAGQRGDRDRGVCAARGGASIGFDPRSGQEPLGPGAVFEGPFGDHTGFYSLPDRYPLLEVTAITHRRRPIYPATVVGLPAAGGLLPRQGDRTDHAARCSRRSDPDILDYDLPMFGAFHNCACCSIRTRNTRCTPAG